MRKLRLKKISLMLLIIFFATTFYQFNLFVEYDNSFKVLGFILLFLTVFLSRNGTKMSFSNLIKTYFIGIFFSCIFCLFYWGQSLIISALALKAYYFMAFYYAIHAIRPSLREINFTILVLGLSYVMTYFINYVTYPELTFGIRALERRGTLSFSIVGTTFMVYSLLLSFYYVRFFKKRGYIIVILLCLSVLLMRASRNAIFAVTVALFVMNFSFIRGLSKYVLGFLFFSILLGFTYLNFQDYFDGLFSLFQSELSLGGNYIRLRSVYHYIFEHPPSFWNYIFGNGFFSGKSEYGDYVINTLWRKRGLYAEDIGLIGFYSYFGIITLMAYIFMLIKLLKKYNFFPVRIFALYLVLMSLATMDSYQLDGILLQTMLFYVSDISLIQKK